MADESTVKRILPHSAEAEQSVIGSMIIDPDAITRAAEFLKSEDFYNKQFGIFFDTIIELQDKTGSVDIVSLRDKLLSKGIPEELCGEVVVPS